MNKGARPDAFRQSRNCYVASPKARGGLRRRARSQGGVGRDSFFSKFPKPGSHLTRHAATADESLERSLLAVPRALARARGWQL